MKLRRTMKAQSPKKKEKERNNSNNNKRRGPRLSQGKGCATRILEGNAQAKLLGLEFQIPQAWTIGYKDNTWFFAGFLMAICIHLGFPMC